MSYEEKKEYEELKSLLYTGTISQYGKRKLIDIFEKQQKEIEELKEKCKEVVCIPEGTCFMLEPKDVDKKWTDKIKAKIEELEKIIEFEKPTYEDVLKYAIEVLQSLLEKE